MNLGLMSAIPLSQLSKGANHFLFTLRKTPSAPKALRLFLHALQFNVAQTARLLSPLGSADDNYSSVKYNDRLYDDLSFYFCNAKLSVVVSFGRKDVLVAVIGKRLSQDRLTRILSQFAVF